MAVALTASVIGLAACGGGGSSSTASDAAETTAETTATSGDSSEGSTQNVVAEAEAAVAEDLKGTDRPLPKSGPKGVTGKKIYAIPCNAAAPGCALTIDAVAEAAKELDWDVTIADGHGTAEGESAAIDAAIAAKADGIILMVIDCAEVKPALERAKDAGIKIFAISSIDCDDPEVNAGPPLFDGSFGTEPEFIQSVWDAVADYVIAETNGEAKIILPVEKQPVITYKYAKAFEKAIEKCDGCTVYTTPVTLNDLTTNKVESVAAAALTAHPDANVVVAPYDAMIQLGIGAAVEAARNSGREILLTGLEGLPANIELIEEGVQDMAPGSQPIAWWGWAAVDGLNRVFAGEPQVDPGFGLQVITEEQNLPTKTPYYNGNAKSQDYPENYRRIWGIG
ncbi:MAG: sugar ABC transporter substrate-binding protein [Solirubrobacterales bacterium]